MQIKFMIHHHACVYILCTSMLCYCYFVWTIFFYMFSYCFRWRLVVVLIRCVRLHLHSLWTCLQHQESILFFYLESLVLSQAVQYLNFKYKFVFTLLKIVDSYPSLCNCYMFVLKLRKIVVGGFFVIFYVFTLPLIKGNTGLKEHELWPLHMG